MLSNEIVLRDDCVILRTGVVVLCNNDATDEVTDDDGDCDAYDGKAFKSLTGLEGEGVICVSTGEAVTLGENIGVRLEGDLNISGASGLSNELTSTVGPKAVSDT